MPAQLAGRVPEDVWAATFDAVYAMTGKELDSQRAAMEQMGGLPMVPCCIPCIVYKAFASMGAVQEMAEEARQAWLALVQREQATYQAYGVHVTLAQEMRVRNSGGSRGQQHIRSELVNVGLKFESADFQMPSLVGGTPVVAAAVLAPPQEEMKRDGGTADELVKLAGLHKAGALTDEEFSAAKAKLLERV